MPAYPLLLELGDRLCVVVGGGAVGQRKLAGLLRAGARVRLIEPRPWLQPLPTGVELRARGYRHGDLDGATLAIAATDDHALNATVASAARAAGILINVADDPGAGDITLPAVLQRGTLSVAVASDGGSPALAALVRDRLASVLGEEWGTVASVAAALRQKRLTATPRPDYNREVLRRLLQAGLAEQFAAGDLAAVDALLGDLCDAGTSLATLGIRIPKGMP